MTELKEEIKYKLIKPLKYTSGGEGFKNAEYITVKAPSVKVRKHIGFIEREYLSAIKKNNEGKKPPTKEELKAAKEALARNDSESNPEEEGNLIMFMIGSSENRECCEDHFFKILYADAMVDDKEKFTELMSEGMSFLDMKNLMGVYLGNFLNLAL